MNRLERLQAILTILQSKRVVRAEDLATRFQTSIRTIYRDIKSLEEGGIPIGAEAGVGYFIPEGFNLPPVMFTYEEARALLFAGKLLEKHSDQTINRHFHNALTKVRAILPGEKKEDLEGLEQKILVNPFPDNHPTHEDLRLDVIKQALSENRIIRLNYAKSEKEKSEREVESIGLCYYYGKWHLIGFCRLRKDYRDFRLDKITDIKILKETFLRVGHPNIREYMDNMMKETELKKAVIRVHTRMLPYIQNSKYNLGLVEEKALTDEWVEMTFATYSYEYFMRWTLMLGKDAEIIFPEEVKERAQKFVKELNEKFSSRGRP